MATKLYDATVKVGEKDGKAIWKTIGVVLQGDKGPYLLMDPCFNPAGVNRGDQTSVMVNLFKPKPKDDSPPPGAGDVPF